MEIETKAGDEARKDRNDKGQWARGVTGNPKGRPRQKKAPRKSLTEHLADAMMDDVVVTNAAGKQERISANEAIARQIVASLPTSTLKEKLAMIASMAKMGVFAAIERRTVNNDLTIEEKRESLAARLDQLKFKHAARKGTCGESS
jgi:hypothetical protein